MAKTRKWIAESRQATRAPWAVCSAVAPAGRNTASGRSATASEASLPGILWPTEPRDPSPGRGASREKPVVEDVADLEGHVGAMGDVIAATCGTDSDSRSSRRRTKDDAIRNALERVRVGERAQRRGEGGGDQQETELAIDQALRNRPRSTTVLTK
jgi:hypothetical protein